MSEDDVDQPEEKEQQPAREMGMIPFACKETQIEGKEYIAVPKGVYQLILLVPKTGTFAKKENGTRIPAFGIKDNDWSLKVDVYLNDILTGPFKRIEVALEKDTPESQPIIKMELIGG